MKCILRPLSLACPPRLRRAMTLCELLVAISILALMSTAITAMLSGGAKVSSAIQADMTYEMETEAALLRIAQQIRMCSAISTQNGISPGTSISLTTQPDPAVAGNAGYPVTYSLVGTQLQENDARFGGVNVLINNVRSFDAHLAATGSPCVVVITLVVGKNSEISRSIKIYARNI